jgi:hypothetical protein
MKTVTSTSSPNYQMRICLYHKKWFGNILEMIFIFSKLCKVEFNRGNRYSDESTPTFHAKHLIYFEAKCAGQTDLYHH